MFDDLLKVLDRRETSHPVLFEFFTNLPLVKKMADAETVDAQQEPQWNDVHPMFITAFRNGGYDYCTVAGSDFRFPMEEWETKETMSLNAGKMIHSREDFQKYAWPDPDAEDYSRLERTELVPEGMKLIVSGPGGVLEVAEQLVGYETLCMILADDPKLMDDLCGAIGERLVRYYQICASYDTVGALISNDDWGFKTQTMLSPADMRKYIFPWHKKIVQVIHAAGKPAILHSCGQLEAVMDDIIDDMQFDGKHSYEDAILPVEQAYEKWHKRIAILGGIDLDFVCRSTPAEIEKRCRAMLGRVKGRGGYALGTGNSVPEYVPDENYFAMIDLVRKQKGRAA